MSPMGRVFDCVVRKVASNCSPVAVNDHAFGAPRPGPRPEFETRPRRRKRFNSFEIWPWSLISAASPIVRFDASGCSPTAISTRTVR